MKTGLAKFNFLPVLPFILHQHRSPLTILDRIVVCYTGNFNGKGVETVKSAKLLGVTISDDLSWNEHVREVVKKASKRLYFLVQLKRARLPTSELVLFYCTCI